MASTSAASPDGSLLSKVSESTSKPRPALVILTCVLWFFYLYADSLYQTPRRVAIKAPQYSLLDSVPAVVDAAVAQNDTSSLAGDWEGRRECVSLMNRSGEKAMYHWIILNLGALWKYFRRGSVVDVYVGDWLTAGGASRFSAR